MSVTTDVPLSARALNAGLLTSEKLSEAARAAYGVQMDRTVRALVELHEAHAEDVARIMADRRLSAQGRAEAADRAHAAAITKLESIVVPTVLDVDRRLTDVQQAGGFTRRLNPNDLGSGSRDPEPFAVADLAAQVAGLRTWLVEESKTDAVGVARDLREAADAGERRLVYAFDTLAPHLQRRVERATGLTVEDVRRAFLKSLNPARWAEAETWREVGSRLLYTLNATRAALLKSIGAKVFPGPILTDDKARAALERISGVSDLRDKPSASSAG